MRLYGILWMDEDGKRYYSIMRHNRMERFTAEAFYNGIKYRVFNVRG